MKKSKFDIVYEQIMSQLKHDVISISPIESIDDAKQLLSKDEVKKIVSDYNINQFIDQSVKQILDDSEKCIKEDVNDNPLINKIYNIVLTKIKDPDKFKTIFKNILLASIIVASSHLLTGCDNSNIKIPKKIEGLQGINTPNMLDTKSPFSPVHTMNSNHPINWRH